MRFSELFQIERTPADDWFDPLLIEDTRLFLDPFLLYLDRDSAWKAAHQRLLSFFNHVLQLLAQSGFKTRSQAYSRASQLLLFPEPHEFCLGFSNGSTMGAGSATGLRDQMIAGARVAITKGIGSVRHFEELAIFGGGMGADRISDIVSNVLKAEFIAYTQRVADRHSLDTQPVNVRHADWDHEYARWIDAVVDLPVNPFSRSAVLLVPRRFLRKLPNIDADDFWDYVWVNNNEVIRTDFNYEIGRNIDGKEIARFARSHPSLVREYVEWREANPEDAYNIDEDPALEVKWYEHGERLADSMPEPPRGPDDFKSFVQELVRTFKRWVEDEGGWEVLWNEETGNRVKERYIQKIFQAVVIHYCRAHDVDLSREADAGRGPVDFKFSHGWTGRALVEIKPLDNPRYRHGLTTQLPTYLAAEDVFVGFFLGLAFSDRHMDPPRIAALGDLAREASESLDREIQLVVIDARRKPSASKA